jgi:hypothetical protein
MTTREAIQYIEKMKLEAFHARFSQHVSSKRCQIPEQPLYAKHIKQQRLNKSATFYRPHPTNKEKVDQASNL